MDGQIAGGPYVGPLLIFIDKCVEGHLSMYADQCIFLCDPKRL